MSDDLRTIFAANLNQLIAKNNVSQLWVAEKLAVSSATVSDWCKGKKAPRMDRIQQLAELFDVSVSNLTEQRSQERDLLLSLAKQIPESKAHMAIQILQSILEDAHK